MEYNSEIICIRLTKNFNLNKRRYFSKENLFVGPKSSVYTILPCNKV